MLEHGAYTLLIDACYDREQFPTLQEAIDWCWARSDEEIQAVTFVLKRFFKQDGDVYVQSRIKEEIEKYQENAAINKRIAKEREARRAEKRAQKETEREQTATDRVKTETDREQTDDEAPPNHKPLTKNQEPFITLFNLFWSAGLVKQKKAKCEDMFLKLLKSSDEPEQFTFMLVNDIKNRKRANQLGFDQLHPSTYLNGQRWEDEIPPPSVNGQGGHAGFDLDNQNYTGGDL